jgi:hypothetical protein
MSPETWTFRSMGVDVVVAGERFDEVRRLFDEWDRTFSRLGVTAGTDRHSALALYASACAAVAAGAGWRALRTRADAFSLRVWPAPAAVVAAEAIVVLAFVVR